MSSFALLNVIIIIGMIISALSLLFIDDLLPSIISTSVLGTLALEFLLLSAPDVALAEAAVGAILTPIIFIITLRKIGDNKKKKEEEK